MRNRITTENATLALCIALLPPIWAVLAPHLQISTGAVALITAGVYVASGNQRRNAVSLSIGFILGDLWACLALYSMQMMSFDADAELFITLFLLGGAAVLLSSLFPSLISLSAWLSGWAIGLTVMTPYGWEGIGTLPLETGVSMLVGVWYVGVLLDLVHRKLLRLFSGIKEN